MILRILSLSLFLSFFAFACSKSDSNACKDNNCGSNGKCVDGACICDAGYTVNPTSGKCEPNDPCATIDCVNGDCVNSVCNCNVGYEKDANGKCTIEQRAKFIANYSASEICIFTGAAMSMVAITSKAGQVNKVNITNISDFGVTYEGTVTANDNVAIIKQNVDIAGTIYEVEGNLKLETNGKITYSYTAKDNLALVSCSGTMTKK